MSANLPRIKVCGLTNLADARCAARAGADGLGFVHHPPSPRHMEAEALAELTRQLAGTGTPCRVLVLVDHEPRATLALARACGVTHVQLTGPASAKDWSGFPLPILRRLAVAPGAEAELDAWQDIATGFVLDHPSTPGGSGLEVDTTLARQLARRAPALLAGGLAPANVGRLARTVGPFGVDASSRLEIYPGQKDHTAVRTFITRAHAALPSS